MSVKTVVRQVSLPQLFHTGHIPADDPLEEHRLQAEHEDSNTSLHGHDAPQTHFSRHAHNCSSNAHALAQAQDESHLSVGRHSPKSHHRLMSHRNFVGLPANPVQIPIHWRRN